MTVFEADGLTKLRQLFDWHLDSGLHHGAQLAVYHDDELVADFAGGLTGPDGNETTSAQRHVLFSCTKPFAAVCLHQLVEDGELDYDDPVCEHWPAFADPGTEKAGVTIRHVLSHQGGFPESAFDVRFDEWTDWAAAVEAMEAVETTFEPGSTAAYHSLTYGWVVGELVRRASGGGIDSYAREHVFEPLDMVDTSIGLSGDDEVTTLTGFAASERCRTSEAGLGGLENEEAAALFNREEIQRATVPAATGIGTARDMARFYACLAANGELDGTRILDADTVERATECQIEVEHDRTMGMPRRYALGFERGGTPWDKYGTLSPNRVFGHGGLGSIVGWADPEERLAMAYVTNGIRDEDEHATRVNTMADAVRAVFA